MIPTSIRSFVVRIVSFQTLVLAMLGVGVSIGAFALSLTGYLPVTHLIGAPVSAATAKDLPMSAAEDVGMSAERLNRIDNVISRAMDAKQISGAVTLVARRGKIAHFEAHGLMDVESGRAMERDTIFPIASMTKPVAGVAILMLVEEGKVRLSDSVSMFIPEFHDTQVAVRRSRNGDDLGKQYDEKSCLSMILEQFL